MKLDPGLERSVLFTHLDARESAALHDIISLEHRRDGAVIFHQGSSSENFYLLLRGRVRLVRTSPAGKELTLHTVEEGHLFAEAAVFAHLSYPATAIVVGNTTVAAIPRDPFITLLRDRPGLALKLITSLSAWVRELAKELADRSLKESGARVAAYLRDERSRAASDAFALPQSKKAIAGQLGMAPESFSRALRRLRDLGILVVDGKRISVCDLSALESAAEEER